MRVSLVRLNGTEIGVHSIEIKLGHRCAPLLSGGSTTGLSATSAWAALASDRKAYHTLRHAPSRHVSDTASRNASQPPFDPQTRAPSARSPSRCPIPLRSAPPSAMARPQNPNAVAPGAMVSSDPRSAQHPLTSPTQPRSSSRLDHSRPRELEIVSLGHARILTRLCAPAEAPTYQFCCCRNARDQTDT